MSLLLVGLIVMAVAALATASYVLITGHMQQRIIARAGGTVGTVPGDSIIGQREAPLTKVIAQRLAAIAPRDWTWSKQTEEALIQAGHDAETAPLMYAAVRVFLAIAVPLVTFVFVPKQSFNDVLLYVICAGVVALVLPPLWLTRRVRHRQEQIRRSLPDALDLIVVCIDAGISLDAAILRVAKELDPVHPDLAGELLVVNRKMNAGMTRAEALRGLCLRTGVQEIRALVSHIVQSEKWGTSSGKVLRVYATTLRRQRRQTAERKAATAPVKMLVPLGAFIFPALLLVILGPVVLNVMTLFK